MPFERQYSAVPCKPRPLSFSDQSEGRWENREPITDRGGVQLVVEAGERLDGGQHLVLGRVAADGEEDVLLGHDEAGREERLECKK